MTLSFPNPSRSFDASKNRVQFWGYDRTIEISFFMEVAALKHLCPEMESAETSFLKTFDALRGRIHEVANSVYAHSNKGKGTYSYILAAGDF